MSLRKIAVTGVAGIAVLTATALIGIRLLGDGTRVGGETTSPATTLEPAPPAPPPAAPAAGQVEPLGPAPAAHPPRAVLPATAPVPAGGGAAPWEAVETALRPAGLGVGLAGPVHRGLAGARAELDRCFEEERRRRAHAKPVSAAPGEFGPAVLILRLEAQRVGSLAVAGTEVKSSGTSSPQLIECCRSTLIGFELDAPAAAPPGRYKVMFLLQ